jgi:hypothetical protein
MGFRGVVGFDQRSGFSAPAMIDQRELQTLPLGKAVDGGGEHETQCPVCCQVFDMRYLDQVVWHNQPEHEPQPRH